MATPMTAAQVLAQLRKWGIRYAEYKNWSVHNRNHMGAWGPVHGFMVHHTGSDGADQRELLYSGLSSLPGPLCQFGLAQDGTVHLIGWGRANHAGSGDPDVLNAVMNETPLPVDNESSVDGNSRFYGVEIWYSGSHAMTPAQYATLRKLAAAICDFHGWSERSVIGHGEWGSPGKWDPGMRPGQMYNMTQVRTDIGVTLREAAPKPPIIPPVVKPKPQPVKPVVDLSELVRAAKQDPRAAQGHQTYATGVKIVEAALRKAGLLASAYASDGSYGTTTIKAYAAWQRKLGYTGSAADGIPGMTSLTKLGAKYGFSVKA